jgi:hypothetical protein
MGEKTALPSSSIWSKKLTFGARFGKAKRNTRFIGLGNTTKVRRINVVTTIKPPYSRGANVLGFWTGRDIVQLSWLINEPISFYAENVVCVLTG